MLEVSGCTATAFLIILGISILGALANAQKCDELINQISILENYEKTLEKSISDLVEIYIAADGVIVTNTADYTNKKAVDILYRKGYLERDGAHQFRFKNREGEKENE